MPDISVRVLIGKTYKNHGFKVVSLLEMSVEKRIEFIKNNINL